MAEASQEIPQPGTTCVRCQVDCGDDLRIVPYAMDVWNEDVSILGVIAGEPVWFCEAVCDDCVPLVGAREETP